LTFTFIILRSCSARLLVKGASKSLRNLSPHFSYDDKYRRSFGQLSQVVIV
jgi:hypothetical protein